MEIKTKSLTSIKSWIDLENISAQAESIFGGSLGSSDIDLDLDSQGGRTFLRVLLYLCMHDYPPLVTGALQLLMRHFSQRQEVLQAFKQVQLLVSNSDVENYKQIKTDLDELRLLVEKSELWVYKSKKYLTSASSGSKEKKKDKKKDKIKDIKDETIDTDIPQSDKNGREVSHHRSIRRRLSSDNSVELEVEHSESMTLKNYKRVEANEDVRMEDIMVLAHEFLQNVCLGNQQNQSLLHKHLDLFLTPGLHEAQTLRYIFMENSALCYEVSERVVQHIIHCIESRGRHVEYLKLLQTLVKAEGQSIRKTQDIVMAELVNVGEEVLVFYSETQAFNSLIEMMQSERERVDESGSLLYHINLVQLLACCTEGKNVYTEIKCHSLLPLDDIVRVVTHPDCIPEVKNAYVNFLNHCYVDTEVEMKEIYTSNHIWTLFEDFLVDMARVCNTVDRFHVDTMLEKYVTETIMNLITFFFNSPFSDASTTIKARQPVFVKLLRGAFRVSQCSWLSGSQKYQVEACIKALSDIAKTRGIAIPGDLETQIQALFTRSQLVMKHTRHWLSHGKVRRESTMHLSRDYRSIIEGLQDIVSLLEDQLRPLIQAESSLLVDVLYRPELIFPGHSEARQKAINGGFVSRLVRHTKQLLQNNGEALCISVLQTLKAMMARDTDFGEKGEALRVTLLKRYYGANFSLSRDQKNIPATIIAKKTVTQLPACNTGPGSTFLSRACVTLFELQCHLDACGLSDLIIDLIETSPNNRIFQEVMEVAIALLEGGNPVIQKSSLHRFMTDKNCEAFFKYLMDKMAEAEAEVKANVTVQTSESTQSVSKKSEKDTKVEDMRRGTFVGGRRDTLSTSKDDCRDDDDDDEVEDMRRGTFVGGRRDTLSTSKDDCRDDDDDEVEDMRRGTFVGGRRDTLSTSKDDCRDDDDDEVEDMRRGTFVGGRRDTLSTSKDDCRDDDDDDEVEDMRRGTFVGGRRDTLSTSKDDCRDDDDDEVEDMRRGTFVGGRRDTLSTKMMMVDEVEDMRRGTFVGGRRDTLSTSKDDCRDDDGGEVEDMRRGTFVGGRRDTLSTSKDDCRDDDGGEVEDMRRGTFVGGRRDTLSTSKDDCRDDDDDEVEDMRRGTFVGGRRDTLSTSKDDCRDDDDGEVEDMRRGTFVGGRRDTLSTRGRRDTLSTSKDDCRDDDDGEVEDMRRGTFVGGRRDTLSTSKDDCRDDDDGEVEDMRRGTFVGGRRDTLSTSKDDCRDDDDGEVEDMRRGTFVGGRRDTLSTSKDDCRDDDDGEVEDMRRGTFVGGRRDTLSTSKDDCRDDDDGEVEDMRRGTFVGGRRDALNKDDDEVEDMRRGTFVGGRRDTLSTSKDDCRDDDDDEVEDMKRGTFVGGRRDTLSTSKDDCRDDDDDEVEDMRRGTFVGGRRDTLSTSKDDCRDDDDGEVEDMRRGTFVGGRRETLSTSKDDCRDDDDDEVEDMKRGTFVGGRRDTLSTSKDDCRDDDDDDEVEDMKRGTFVGGRRDTLSTSKDDCRDDDDDEVEDMRRRTFVGGRRDALNKFPPGSGFGSDVHGFPSGGASKGDSKAMAPEVIAMKPILRFLQLLCENHNRDLQNYIRRQDNNKTNYNLVHETLQFLECICGSTSGGLGLLGLYINENNVGLINQCLDSLTEYCQGPCHENQTAIALHESNGIDIVIALVLNDINPLGKQRMDLVLELKNTASKTLLAIMESRHDSENSERILYNLTPKQLVDVCKQAYHQDLLDDEESGVSPRDVGHNIYILATLLSQQNKDLASLLKVGTTVGSDAEELSGDSALDYYAKNTAQIEVVRQDRIMEQIVFPVPQICEFLTDESKNLVYTTCERDDRNSKVSDFFDRTEDLYQEMEWQKKLREHRLLFGLSSRLSLWQQISMNLAVLINVLVGFFYPFSDGPGELDPRLSALVWLAMLVSFAIIITFPRPSGIRTFVGSAIIRLIFSLGLEPTLYLLGVAIVLNKAISVISFVGNHGTFQYGLRRMLTDKELILHLTYFGFGVLGLTVHTFFYSILLLDVILREETLLNVIRSVTRNGRSIILTAVLALILVYMFSLVAFLFLKDDFLVETDPPPAIAQIGKSCSVGDKSCESTFTFSKRNLPDDNKKDEISPVKERACDTLIMCIVTTLNQGLRNGGGIGDVLRRPSSTEKMFAGRVIYDLLFFFVVIIIVLNLIFGVIIDTFADLRSEKQTKDEVLKNTCFICGLDRSAFDNKSVSFEEHIKHQHNMWHYLYFIVLLKVKDPTEFTGPESYAMQMIK
ncbi:hypothetical protein QZH41_016593, partial [Actinostola sp. cb2023]